MFSLPHEHRASSRSPTSPNPAFDAAPAPYRSDYRQCLSTFRRPVSEGGTRTQHGAGGAAGNGDENQHGVKKEMEDLGAGLCEIVKLFYLVENTRTATLWTRFFIERRPLEDSDFAGEVTIVASDINGILAVLGHTFKSYSDALAKRQDFALGTDLTGRCSPI
jgi:hypothetical protein